ncbi:MAG: class 1 fructose-bisphosphatase [archaeon]|nr:class 1 fructose-bisphosphatase [archaeon]
MFLEEHLVAVPFDVKTLVLAVAGQSKAIAGGFLDHSRLAGTKNIYGEDQLELDKWADQLLIDAFEETGIVRNVASEEQGEIVEIVKARGSWGITIDPLDGVSCVKTNLAVGTIVGMFNEGDVLEKGSMMDAACFVLYGPLTTLVYAYKGKGVHEFALDKKTGRFVLREESITIPQGEIYGSGGLKSEWTDAHAKFISELEKNNYKLRYSGSLTADFNQVLHYGGVFCYPALKNKPEGKLRLLFEANPLSFIAAEANGAGSNGVQSILDVEPKKISDRTPLYLGDKKTIALAEKFLKQ